MGCKERVVQAATQLFSQKGFAETATAEIARSAGVAQGTLFYHFKTKEGILLEVLDSILTPYLEGMESIRDSASSGICALTEILRFHFRFLQSRIDETLVVLRDFPVQLLKADDPLSQLIRGKIAKVLAVLEACIQRGVDEGVFRVPDSLKAAHMVHGLLGGLTREMLLGPMEVPPMEAEVIRFCLHALGASRCNQEAGEEV